MSGNLLCNFYRVCVRKTQTAFDSDGIKITKYVCQTPIYLTCSGETSLVLGFNLIRVSLCLCLNVSVVACCGCRNNREVGHSLLILLKVALFWPAMTLSSSTLMVSCNTLLFFCFSISHCFAAPPCSLSQHPLQHSSQQSTPKDTALIKTYSNTASADEGPKLWQHKWAHSPSHTNSKLHL